MLGRLGQFDGVVGNAIMLPLWCKSPTSRFSTQILPAAVNVAVGASPMFIITRSDQTSQTFAENAAATWPIQINDLIRSLHEYDPEPAKESGSPENILLTCPTPPQNLIETR